MARFIPKEKLSKKAQKELNRQRRVTWDFSPVTKAVDSRKIYSRKRKAQNRDDYGLSFYFSFNTIYSTIEASRQRTRSFFSALSQQIRTLSASSSIIH